ncbi:MAG: RES domain-containing protein [Cyclobacteriaceae bacterium]|jgi:RES domain-containing protein
MIVYRLAAVKYANSLNSSGASNRWNKHGQYVIYASMSISLCALELLAHTSGIRPAGEFKVMNIEIDDAVAIHPFNISQLPENWNSLSAYPFTQQFGSEWYKSQKTLLMNIPSAIIPSESNVIINTFHPDFSEKVKLKDVQDFFWDNRFPSN